MSRFGGAGFDGAGSVSDGPSGDGASGGPRTVVERMLSGVRGLFVFVQEANPPRWRPATARSAALESVRSVIARLEGKVEESVETESEDSFYCETLLEQYYEIFNSHA
jgi:hypothetical protein